MVCLQINRDNAWGRCDWVTLHEGETALIISRRTSVSAGEIRRWNKNIKFTLTENDFVFLFFFQIKMEMHFFRSDSSPCICNYMADGRVCLCVCLLGVGLSVITLVCRGQERRLKHVCTTFQEQEEIDNWFPCIEMSFKVQKCVCTWLMNEALILRFRASVSFPHWRWRYDNVRQSWICFYF